MRGDHHRSPVAAQRDGASELVIRVRVRGLHVVLLTPRGAGAAEEVHGAGLRRLVIILLAVYAAPRAVLERRPKRRGVSIAAQRRARAEPIVRPAVRSLEESLLRPCTSSADE